MCDELHHFFGIKFQGPYSDGREWDAKLKQGNAIDVMKFYGKFASWLEKKGYTKPDTSISDDWAFKVDRKTSISFAYDANSKSISFTVYSK